MKLSGFGGWGVEDVSRATGVSRRVLRHWHAQGWACATSSTAKRHALRYSRDDIPRLCMMAALREKKISPKKAATICDAFESKVRAAFHVEPRPIVTFGAIQSHTPLP